MIDASIQSPAAAQAARDLYIDLMKKCLSFALWEGKDGSIKPSRSPAVIRRAKQVVGQMLGAAGKQPNFQARVEGRDWPVLAHTMIGFKRLDNVQHCVEHVIKNGIPGDLIETGVWRGGSTIFMRSILKAYGVTDRTVWVADSFQGLPPPDAKNYPADRKDSHHKQSDLAVSVEQVQANFEKYGLLDDQVRFLKGWFKDTLPTAPIKKLAVARLDGDMYESTMDGLKALYPKLSPGGFLIVDDYGAVPACKKAVEDYRKEHNITEEMQSIDWTGAFWQRRLK